MEQGGACQFERRESIYIDCDDCRKAESKREKQRSSELHQRLREDSTWLSPSTSIRNEWLCAQ
ncbi:hypothetical protein U1Q18_021711, partial [Sarracenia purpurea var. burkii]